MKKIAIIGSVGIPAKYGGFETLAEYLTIHLAEKYDITVFCSSKSYIEKQSTHNNARLKYIPFKANGAQSIPYDILSIFKSLFFADVLLILGVSGCIVLPFIKLLTRKKIIVNIDGLEWKRHKWKKSTKWFLKYSEKIAVKYADDVIADNKEIQNYIQHEYAKPSHLIAYGGNHAIKEKMSLETLNKFPFLNSPYALKVCRIEPENNIEMILDAFENNTKYSLVFIGNWNNSEFGKELKLKFSKLQHIHLLDPIYNQKTLNEIRSCCSFYVHGHSAGGTNPSLVEAMSLSLPILSFGASYNIATTKGKAMYFDNSKELIELINTTNTSQLMSNSFEMKKIADEMYNWEKISISYSKLF